MQVSWYWQGQVLNLIWSPTKGNVIFLPVLNDLVLFFMFLLEVSFTGSIPHLRSEAAESSLDASLAFL